jgi:putative tryptophan/tyrosine transport system substrate-binding protein
LPIFDSEKNGLNPMSRRVSLVLLLVLLLTSIRTAEAQPAAKVYRIGYLLEGSPSGGMRLLDAFRQGMRDFGYVERKDFVIEARWAEGNNNRLSALAAELVRLNVDLIVTAPTPPALAAHRATKTIPIVVARMSDPVEVGLVADLSRPGGNVTGARSMERELGGKRLELLREAFPKISRVAVLGAGVAPGGREQLREMETAAQALRLELRPLEWKRPNIDFHSLSRSIIEMRATAITVVSSLWHLDYLTSIVDLAAKTRLPAIYPNRLHVEAGGLMSYGTNWEDFHRRAAYFVDKILKDAKPSELPVEQPTKFELVVNLKAAKQIGVTIPPHILMDADKVIK